jgi:hypothetical protein
VPLAEKGAWGKGRQPLSPPQRTVARSAISAPNRAVKTQRYEVRLGHNAVVHWVCKAVNR